MMDIKIAIFQSHIYWEDKEKNIEKAKYYIDKAVKENTDIIFFPEMSFTGFSTNIVHTYEKNEETKTCMKQLAKQKKVFIGFGWVQQSQEKAENHYTIVDTEGNEAADYIKIHSFKPGGEGDQFIAGDQIKSFHIGKIQFVPFICYDLRFPEIFRTISEDPSVFVIAANWPEIRAEHWKCLLQARAIENQAYVLGINCVGDVGGLSYSGDSRIVNPSGEIVSHLSKKEGLLYANIRESDYNIRQTFPVRADRREDVYSWRHNETVNREGV